MFDLEQAIAEWRRQMLVAGIKSPCVLDELESHLRDDVEQKVAEGMREQEAFTAAVRQIGRANVLKSEFVKVGETVGEQLKRFFLFSRLSPFLNSLQI